MSEQTYNQILSNSEETIEPVKTSMKAYEVVLHLANPDRLLFSDFMSQQNRTQAVKAIRLYLDEFGASSIGRRMGDQVRAVILKDMHHSFHKTALVSAVGQAYMDLCLGISIAQYCSSEAAVDLSYGEYISYINKSFDQLEKELPVVSESCKLLPIGRNAHKDYPLLFALSENDLNVSIARKRVSNAIEILILFHKNKIKYNELYEDIVPQIEEYVKQSEDDIFFSHVVTVLRNKDQFSESQYSHINDLYNNRFTEEQKEAHKANIPAKTPDVSSTQAFFFKGESKTNDLANLV